MSVFTTVTPSQLETWLRDYPVGALSEMKGILSGIENTNYFVTTSEGRYVLTLFEKLQAHQLPFYLELMDHLSRLGIRCPRPIASQHGKLLGTLNGKPAALVTRLDGAPVMAPVATHCQRVGEALASLHLAGQSYPAYLENLRGDAWWRAVAPEILPFLSTAQQHLLRSEIDFVAQHTRTDLPRGVVHADLFRDNVLFKGDAIGGLIDFYFACVDTLVYDVAITLNDWCMGRDGRLDQARVDALLSGYETVRPLSDAERDQLPVMLRAGALRFWVSRLYDYHLPRHGEMTHAHDPEQFRVILQNHIEAPCGLGARSKVSM